MLTNILSNISLILLISFFTFNCHAKEPNWKVYDKFLKKHVETITKNNSKINWIKYSQIIDDPQFNQVIKLIENFPVKELKSLDERKAFYINAYNIFAIKHIVDNWPVSSIKDVGNFLSPVWYKEAGYIDNKRVSLNQIEHRILRKMQDPRIHFAINCASFSCPDLRIEAYKAKIINYQLNEQAKTFLQNPQKGLKVTNNGIYVSKIFKWFKRDFNSVGGINKFIAQYHEIPENQKVYTKLPYYWELNGN